MRKIAQFFGKALYNAFLAVFGISLVGATIAVAIIQLHREQVRLLVLLQLLLLIMRKCWFAIK